MKAIKTLAIVFLCVFFAGTFMPYAAAEDIVTYAVTGGNLYFDRTTGTVTDCDESVTAAVIPATIGGQVVTSIGNDAFYNCENLTIVHMPEGITSIGEYAFAWCWRLPELVIPESVTKIGNYAFTDCQSLTGLSIPAKVASLGEEIFGECVLLASVDVHPGNSAYCSVDGVLYSKDMTEFLYFPEGKDTASFVIPDGVRIIAKGAFDRCKLSEITLPASVTEIQEWAFSRAYHLSSIRVSSQNEHYKDVNGVLYSLDMKRLLRYPPAHSITAFTVPESVTSVGTVAFYCCENLESLALPQSLTTIGNWTFAYCRKLTSLVIPDGVTEIDYLFFLSCESLSDVTIPASVTKIKGNAFEGCTKLTDVYFGGNKAQWDAVEILDGNECLRAANIHYNGGDTPTNYKTADITSVSLDGGTVTVDIQRGIADAFAFCAFYDADGKIVSVGVATLSTGENHLTFQESASFATVKVITADGQFIPLCNVEKAVA